MHLWKGGARSPSSTSSSSSSSRSSSSSSLSSLLLQLLLLLLPLLPSSERARRRLAVALVPACISVRAAATSRLSKTAITLLLLRHLKDTPRTAHLGAPHQLLQLLHLGLPQHLDGQRPP